MYPQPSPDQQVIAGNEFFRLQTTLVSDGDIYESPQSSHAFALGPDSDVSRVNFAYFDKQAAATGFMVQGQVSPQRSFTGLVNARNSEGLYSPSNRPGKVLIWPDELYNPTAFPVGCVPASGDRLEVVPPLLDVIQYFSAPAVTLDAQRSDKTFLLQRIPWPARDYYLMLPFYGRRFLSLSFKNRSAVPITVTTSGLNFAFSTGSTSLFSGDNNTQSQFATQAVAAAATYSLIAGASTKGLWDYLVITFAPGGGVPAQNTPLKITVSDVEP